MVCKIGFTIVMTKGKSFRFLSLCMALQTEMKKSLFCVCSWSLLTTVNIQVEIISDLNYLVRILFER